MKPSQFWSAVLGLLISILVLCGYAYNVSSYAATLGEKVWNLQRQREEDKHDIKENLNYIRDRVDEIAREMKTNPAAASCGQCKDH
jgi:cell division protein FtsL